MKKAIIITLLVILGIGVAAIVTCPDKQAHKDAIMDVVNQKINEELHTDDQEYQGLSALFGSLGSGIASRIVDNRLVVKNHFLWSTGEFQDLDGNYNQVSAILKSAICRNFWPVMRSTETASFCPIP